MPPIPTTNPILPGLLGLPAVPAGAVAQATEAAPLLSVDDVLKPYVWVFYLSFIVSIVLTPVMRHVAFVFGIIDNPDNHRKVHREPTAYLGGVAIFVAWICGVALSPFMHWHYWNANHISQLSTILIPVTVLGGAATSFLLGFWDDIKGIRPRTKIAGQVTAAILLLASNVGTSLTQPFLWAIAERVNRAAPMGLHISPEVLAWSVLVSSCALTIAIVVFCCNASNLMDGLDGLCGGVTSIIAVGFLALAVVLAMRPDITSPKHVNMDAVRVIIALALLGSTLGFVPHNFNPASIFMGDAGSLFLGFMSAMMIVMLGEADPRWLLGAMVMFSLPVLDTALAFARRYVAGRPFFSADKQHIHHQLISRGMGVKQAVLAMYGLAIFFVMLGMSLILLRVRYAVALYLVIFGCIVVAAYKMGMIHERHKKATGAAPPPPPSGDLTPLIDGPAHDASTPSNGDTLATPTRSAPGGS
jgi:UDP-GlcNAc:undecaprenyl-phosphate/decaprenyl-phosphate GlcNAc-1-phosphate transferase